MEEERSILELISDVTEFNEFHLYFMDEDVDQAMAAIIKLISKPDATRAAAPLVVRLQALSSKFALMAKYHMLYDTEETKEEKTRKKNTFMTLSAELEKLANAVKYLVK